MKDLGADKRGAGWARDRARGWGASVAEPFRSNPTPPTTRHPARVWRERANKRQVQNMERRISLKSAAHCLSSVQLLSLQVQPMAVPGRRQPYRTDTTSPSAAVAATVGSQDLQPGNSVGLRLASPAPRPLRLSARSRGASCWWVASRIVHFVLLCCCCCCHLY